MKYAVIFFLGAAVYAFIEIAWRGRTHWSMLLCGGACFSAMYVLSAMSFPLVLRALISAAAVTAAEFFTGCIVNLRLGMKVWDYSDARFNLCGQICPLFSAFWFLLSLPGIMLCEKLRELF